MNISILTADFSGNCYGRSYHLANLLNLYHNVKIIGPQFGKSIWSPLMNNGEIDIIPIAIPYRTIDFIKAVTNIIRKCNTDIIYATKPLFTSFGTGIIAKNKLKKPLILDIDDWELAPFFTRPVFRQAKNAVRDINKPISYFPTYIMEKLIKSADSITVASSVLKRKYGGMIIPHVRKIPLHKTKPAEKTNITIMFLGTPRPHKGLEDLIAAFLYLKHDKLILKIIGMNFEDPYCKQIAKITGNDSRIKLMPFIPFNTIEKAMSEAEIIVIPQRDTYVGNTQTPAKLFDAMAYGKAIITTRVSDIPEILGDCGIIVTPARVDELYKALEFLIDNPKMRKQLGKKAQDRCATVYNYNNIARKLSRYIEEAQCQNT